MAMKLNLTGAAAAAASTDRKPSQGWANIGYMSEDENGEPMFVGLTRGVPLDDLPVARTNTNNAGFNALNEGKNQLAEQLQALIEQFEPGQEGIVQQLVVQLRRVNEEAVPEAGKNPHTAALAKLKIA